MNNEEQFWVWQTKIPSKYSFDKDEYNKDDCIEWATAVSLYLNEIMKICSDFNSTVLVTEDGAKVMMPKYTAKYTSSIQKVRNCATDFFEGYKRAQKATMIKVKPHLKVSYRKQYPLK